MRTAARAAVIALAVAAVATAGASAADTPEPGTLGLTLTPAPLHVDAGDRSFTAYNRSGGLALTVELTASTGYAVEPATFTLPDGGSQVVTVTAVNPEADGTLDALASTKDVSGDVRSVIALTTRFVHATWLERNPAAIPAGLLLALVAGLVILALVRRRYRS